MKDTKRVVILSIIFLFIVFFACLKVINDYNYNKLREESSFHYINNLYYSSDEVYNKFLNTGEKKFYDLIVDNSINHKAKTKIDMDEFGCGTDYNICGNYIRKASSAVWADHPELMNYAGYRWYYHNNEFKLTLQFAYHLKYKDKYGEYRIDKYLDKIQKETKDMTDEEKIKYVYEWMSGQAVYDKKYMLLSENQSIYNVFVNKNAVCAGFAKASQIIFNRIGIKSYIVQGDSTGPHMWNIVLYNGKYYFFDATVGVSYHNKSSYSYYNGLKQTYMNSYSMYYPEWYPKVESDNMFK